MHNVNNEYSKFCFATFHLYLHNIVKRYDLHLCLGAQSFMVNSRIVGPCFSEYSIVYRGCIHLSYPRWPLLKWSTSHVLNI